MVCGYNHTFGKKGGGTPALLAALGDALGFSTAVVPKITLKGQEVSSTAIRGLAAPGRRGPRAGVVGAPLSAPGGGSRSPGRALGAVYDAQRQAGCAQGKLPALCSDGEHTWPVLLRVEREGRALCSLPAGTTLHDELEIRFLTSLSVDS